MFFIKFLAAIIVAAAVGVLWLLTDTKTVVVSAIALAILWQAAKFCLDHILASAGVVAAGISILLLWLDPRILGIKWTATGVLFGAFLIWLQTKISGGGKGKKK